MHSHAPHNNILVNKKPHVRRWSYKMIKELKNAQRHSTAHSSRVGGDAGVNTPTALPVVQGYSIYIILDHDNTCLCYWFMCLLYFYCYFLLLETVLCCTGGSLTHLVLTGSRWHHLLLTHLAWSCTATCGTGW